MIGFSSVRPGFLGLLLIIACPLAAAPAVHLRVNGTTYVPFEPTLDAVSGAHVWLAGANEPETTSLRATQRCLGYREVAYKAALFSALAATPAKVTTEQDVSVHDFGKLSRKTGILGYWADKNVPIVVGPDGKAYITDGHHTTAGFLETNRNRAMQVLPGVSHPVLGHVVANYYDPAAGPRKTDDAFWLMLVSQNNALLQGPAGNQLALPTDRLAQERSSLLPSTKPMPLIPGKEGPHAMEHDPYRSLLWGVADGIVDAAMASDKPIKGISKMKAGPGAEGGGEINFVEFLWGDFMRNRIVWDDALPGEPLGKDPAQYLSPANGRANLIAAPVGFFLAVGNAIALARSENYRDQFGRSLADYDAEPFSANVRAWARSSLAAGGAKPGDHYRIHLTDHSLIRGDILPSGLEGVTNELRIDTQVGLVVEGRLANFHTLRINAGGTVETRWKDASDRLPNSRLTVPAGSGKVRLLGAHDFSRLDELQVAAGSLVLEGTLPRCFATVAPAASLDCAGLLRDVHCSGQLSPAGRAVGLLRVDGTLVQGERSTLCIDISDTTTGRADLVNVGGRAVLSGVLRVNFLEACSPRRGDRVTILTAWQIEGAFDTVSFPTTPGITWRLEKVGRGELCLVAE